MDIPRKPRPRRLRIVLPALVSVTLLGGTLAVLRMEPALPSVELRDVATDTVRRGDMVRRVRAPGTLVPERVRIVTAVTAGRVEGVFVQPGDQVAASTVLIELSNPDVQLEELDAQRQLAAAEAELANLRFTLETQRLNQEAAVHALVSEFREAERKVRMDEELARERLVARSELERSRERLEELQARLAIERRLLQIAEESIAAQLAVQENQIARLTAIASFQEGRRLGMRVSAGSDGVLQDMPVQVGQWAAPGEEIARVLEPGRLKAVLRVPETQAREVAVGQAVQVDTRSGVVPGRVSRIDPAVQGGALVVDVTLDGELPPGARPDLTVDGEIEVERLPDALHVRRPSFSSSGGQATVFRMEPDGRSAVRVPVRFGRGSVTAIEIAEGLEPGDVVILSELPEASGHPRIRIR